MTILLRQFAFLATVAFIAATLNVAAASAPAEPGSDEEFEQVMALMTQRLSLSPYQVEKIGPRVREHLDSMRELFASYRYGGAGSLPSLMQEFEEMREDFRVDMDVHLNDKQMLGVAEIRGEVDESIRDTVIDHRVDTLREKLALSDEQLAAVRPIVAETFDERQRLMSFHTEQGGGGARLQRNLGPEVKAVEEKMEQRLQEVLTKAQMDQYHQFLEEKRQYLREKEAVSR
jgi:hypothetical protein